MKKLLFSSIFILILILLLSAFLFIIGHKKSSVETAMAQVSATENLDEMITRISRYGTASWGANYLENAANNYTWQPETLMYKDVTTGHEVWVLTHAPNKVAIGEYYSKEHGTNAWSFDGSKVGFYSYNDPPGTGRPTQNPNAGLWHFLWVVNTDGSGLRNLAESYGRRTIHSLESFGWAHNENAFYTFGSISGDPNGTDNLSKLYKVTVNNNNVGSASMILDTTSLNAYQKDILKEGVSTDDSHITFRDMTYRPLNTPNPISCSAVYFANIKGTPSVTSWWGVARHIGPSTNNWADPYGDLVSSLEEHFHDAWSPGPTGSWIMGEYAGTALFNIYKSSGSAGDGGPLWQDWNGTSFGTKKEIEVISDGAGTPDNPWGDPYFGHPVFDRWGRYMLFANYNDPFTCAYGDNCKPGMMIYDVLNHTFLSNYPFQYNSWTSNHHSWTGWTDWVIATRGDTFLIEANKWDATTKPGGTNYQAPTPVVYAHTIYAGNYNAYPRPSQSPDGTKVAFSQDFLNGSQDYPYIAWAVVYYPYPPTNLSASYSGGVRLSWLPPKYTTRGWPNESADPAPYAREVKKYHIWRSTSQTSGWQEIGSVNATYHNDSYYGPVHDTANLNLTDNPGSGTFYYAITTEEQSRLESDELSEILRVTVSGTSVSSQVVQAKGQKNFWRTAPGAPSGFSYSAQSTAGQYRLNWTQSNDTKVRYYNIYYSNSTNPTAIQQQRIASVPTGTATYLDWLADASAAGHYGITSVDRYGNESAIVLSGTSDTTPPAAPSGVGVN